MHDELCPPPPELGKSLANGYDNFSSTQYYMQTEFMVSYPMFELVPRLFKEIFHFSEYSSVTVRNSFDVRPTNETAGSPNISGEDIMR